MKELCYVMLFPVKIFSKIMLFTLKAMLVCAAFPLAVIGMCVNDKKRK